MSSAREQLTGWGRLGIPGRERCDEDLCRATRGATLTRGLGRSYGDSSLPARGVTEVVGSRPADRLLGFDPGRLLLHTEAGASLREILRSLQS